MPTIVPRHFKVRWRRTIAKPSPIHGIFGPVSIPTLVFISQLLQTTGCSYLQRYGPSLRAADTIDRRIFPMECQMITGIAHAAYGVKDLEASLQFYTAQLGLERAFELRRDDGSLWIVYLACGDGTFIELFPETNVTKQPETASYKHLCLRVDDTRATLDAMKRRGLEPLNPPSVGKDGNTQAWVRDPDGNPIELMEIAPDSEQGRFIAKTTKR